MATCRSMLLSLSSGTVSKLVFTDESWTTSPRDCLHLLLLDTEGLRDCAGVVGTDEACRWSLTRVLESRHDEGIE